MIKATVSMCIAQSAPSFSVCMSVHVELRSRSCEILRLLAWLPGRALTFCNIHILPHYLLSSHFITQLHLFNHISQPSHYKTQTTPSSSSSMKFTTATLLLALAALTVANPVASPVADPVADPQGTSPPVDKPNCRDCDNNYTKCRAVSQSSISSPSGFFTN